MGSRVVNRLKWLHPASALTHLDKDTLALAGPLTVTPRAQGFGFHGDAPRTSGGGVSFGSVRLHCKH
jgi:hypothetical protein